MITVHKNEIISMPHPIEVPLAIINVLTLKS